MTQHNRRKNAYRPVADINMTPFIDVMMVLLIIFMVTAPLATVGIDVNLPKSSASEVPLKKDPIAISIREDGTLYMQETEISMNELLPRLEAMATEKKMLKGDVRILLRADKSLAYGRVMTVMSDITEAGFTRVAMITTTE